MTVLVKDYFIFPTAFSAGYALHYLNGQLLEHTRDYTHADLYQGIPENTYRQRFMEQLARNAPPGSSIPAYVKTQALYNLIKMMSFAILEEIAFRHILQRRFLPSLIERITTRGIIPLAVTLSATTFSLLHLGNKEAQDPSQRKALVIHTLILGLIAGMSREKFSLQAAIALHLGYNARAWKCTYYNHFPSPEFV